MEYLLLAVATVLCSGKALVTKLMGKTKKSAHDVLLMNSVLFLIGAIVAGLMGMKNNGSIIHISMYSVVFAAVLSVFLLSTIVMQIYAMNSGPASLGSLIYSLGFLVPILYSAAFLGENISFFQCLGIGAMIVSLVLIIPPEKGRKLSFLWVVSAFFAMLGSGTSAVVQKLHQNSPFKDELCAFLLYALFFASLLAFVAALILKIATKGARFSLFDKKQNIVIMIASGIVVGLMNVINTSLTGRLPAIIQFPVYNICSMIITALWGKAFFKESLSGRKLVGFILGLICVTVIGLL